MQALLEHFITQSTVFIDGGGVGGLSGVAGAGRFDSTRYGADGGAGSADWQRRVKFLARLAGRDCRLSAGRLDLLLAGAGVLKTCVASPVISEEKTKHYSIKLNMRCINWHVHHSGRSLCWPDASAGANGGGNAGSAGGKIHYAEYYRLPAVATVLLPAWDSGGRVDIPAGMQSGSLNGCCWRRRYLCGLVAGCAGGYGAAVKQPIV